MMMPWTRDRLKREETERIEREKQEKYEKDVAEEKTRLTRIFTVVNAEVLRLVEEGKRSSALVTIDQTQPEDVDVLDYNGRVVRTRKVKSRKPLFIVISTTHEGVLVDSRFGEPEEFPTSGSILVPEKPKDGQKQELWSVCSSEQYRGPGWSFDIIRLELMPFTDYMVWKSTRNPPEDDS